MTFDDLRASISVEEAIEAFLEGTNKGPERLWITEGWIQPRLERLRQAISGPLTADQAEQLRAVVLKRERFDRVLEWMEERPAITWAAFQEREEQKLREMDLATAREEFEQWEAAMAGTHPRTKPTDEPHYPIIFRELTEPRDPQTDHLSKARSCSVCGTPAADLTWTHMAAGDISGPMAGGGWEGWITICTRCKLRVQVFGIGWVS